MSVPSIAALVLATAPPWCSYDQPHTSQVAESLAFESRITPKTRRSPPRLRPPKTVTHIKDPQKTNPATRNPRNGERRASGTHRSAPSRVHHQEIRKQKGTPPPYHPGDEKSVLIPAPHTHEARRKRLENRRGREKKIGAPSVSFPSQRRANGKAPPSVLACRIVIISHHPAAVRRMQVIMR